MARTPPAPADLLAVADLSPSRHDLSRCWDAMPGTVAELARHLRAGGYSYQPPRTYNDAAVRALLTLLVD